MPDKHRKKILVTNIEIEFCMTSIEFSSTLTNIENGIKGGHQL